MCFASRPFQVQGILLSWPPGQMLPLQAPRCTISLAWRQAKQEAMSAAAYGAVVHGHTTMRVTPMLLTARQEPEWAGRSCHHSHCRAWCLGCGGMPSAAAPSNAVRRAEASMSLIRLNVHAGAHVHAAASHMLVS